jgi:hypothetical protein
MCKCRIFAGVIGKVSRDNNIVCGLRISRGHKDKTAFSKLGGREFVMTMDRETAQLYLLPEVNVMMVNGILLGCFYPPL